MNAITLAPVARPEAAALFAAAIADLDDGTTGFAAGEPLRDADLYLRVDVDGVPAALVWFWPFLRASVCGIARHPVYWYGIVLDPVWRDRRLGRVMTARAARWIFDRHAHVATIVVAVRTSNARSLASLRANPIYRPVGTVKGVQPGVDVILAQITRESLEQPVDHDGTEYSMRLRPEDAPILMASAAIAGTTARGEGERTKLCRPGPGKSTHRPRRPSAAGRSRWGPEFSR